MDTLNLLFKKPSKFIFTLACLLTCTGALQVKAQSKETTKINFQKDKYNRIFIPVKIDRDSLSLLFGTYSKTLRLTPYFMDTWSLYPTGQVLTMKDYNGKRKERLVFSIPKVEIGNFKFRNEETVVNYAFPDTVVTGSTGTLMVYQYNWKIDNDRNEISISKKPFEPVQPFSTINYKNDAAPTVNVEIDGIKDDFALDFGSGVNFQVNTGTALGKKIIADHNLEPVNTLTSNIHARKLVDTIYEVVIPSLLFNGQELKNQKVRLSSASPQNVIGTGLLGNYNVILNNSKKRKTGNVFILEKRLVN
jgi:hypothetical protein